MVSARELVDSWLKKSELSIELLEDSGLFASVELVPMSELIAPPWHCDLYYLRWRFQTLQQILRNPE